MRLPFAVIAVLVIGVMLSCGGAPDLPPESQVSLSLAPLFATIPVNGTVDLQGSISGLSAPYLDWWMQEKHDQGINGSEDCDDITPANQNLIANCPFGYLTGSGLVQATSATATYHAPSTPGSYHVTLRGFQLSSQQWGEGIEKRAAASITVTP
jgi:hypothetical protein